VSVPSDFSLRLAIPALPESAADARVPQIADEVVALFDELGDRLLRYLLCLGLSPHDGEEIVQECFLLLFQHLRRGKSRENLRGWLFKVARNLAFKQLRKMRWRERQVVPVDELVAASQAGMDLDPEQQACLRQRQRQLWAVMKALPERDQSCLFLRAEGLRYREIAESLGVSLGSVAASLARSLGKLARADGGSR
jgi:RNA polymerase sigma-70 factor, ECF subfamily